MSEVTVSVVPETSPPCPAPSCRRMIVGPGVNQPDPFPGYTGMVGWSCPVRLRNGTMFVTFSAGYWHGSYPTPLDLTSEHMQRALRAGMPTDVDAPRGGRAMIVKSIDDGATWTPPHPSANRSPEHPPDRLPPARKPIPNV